MSINNKIRIGLVGCGKASMNHLQAIKDLSEHYELASVCDKHADFLKPLTTQFNVNGYTELKEMLDKEKELEVVTLCSPSGFHAQQTVMLASHKKHIITEKPMATRWSDGLKMVKSCDQEGVQLFVVKQNRFQPSFQLLKKSLYKKRFGRIYMINLNVFWTRPQAYYDQAKWRGTWEFDGGALMNQASHYVDFLTWCFGPIQSVNAMMSTLNINMEAEDSAVLNLRWRSGILGSMNVTMLTFPKNLESSVTILGEHGTVRLSGLSANRIEHWEFAQPDEEDIQADELKKENADRFSGHHHFYQNVARALRGEPYTLSDGREGLRSLEVMIAAYRSARDNVTVNLPLEY